MIGTCPTSQTFNIQLIPKLFQNPTQYCANCYIVFKAFSVVSFCTTKCRELSKTGWGSSNLRKHQWQVERVQMLSPHYVIEYIHVWTGFQQTEKEHTLLLQSGTIKLGLNDKILHSKLRQNILLRNKISSWLPYWQPDDTTVMQYSDEEDED